MAQQWFLDLDGIRSGPYKTHEVLSLISEGEILPHHLISSDIKNSQWHTLLNWQISYQKTEASTGQKKEVVDRSEVEESGHLPPPAPFLDINVSNEFYEGPLPPEAPPEPVLQVQDPPFELHLEERPKGIEPIDIPAPIPEPERELSPPPKPKLKEPEPTLERATPLPPKRDPMAEMFDLVQKTKHKREEKEAQAIQSHEAHQKENQNKSSPNQTFWKTLGYGAAITLIGFWLGQWFQSASQPPQVGQAQSPIAEKKEPENPPKSEAPSSNPPLANNEQVIDRSTDKMTIQAKVKTKPESPVVANDPKDNKEIKELQDLKKELQDLKKSMREELEEPVFEEGMEHPEVESNDHRTADYNNPSIPQPSTNLDYNSNNVPLDPNSPPGQAGDLNTTPKQINNPDIHY